MVCVTVASATKDVSDKAEHAEQSITNLVQEVVENDGPATEPGPTVRMLATAYTHAPPEGDVNGTGDGLTATGTPVRPGVVAVDPEIIPYGAVVCVHGLGCFRAEDTGGEIRGNRIDIFVPSRSDALKFGRRWVDVQILGPVPDQDF